MEAEGYKFQAQGKSLGGPGSFYNHGLQSAVKYFNCYSALDLPVCFSSMVKINKEQEMESGHLWGAGGEGSRPSRRPRSFKDGFTEIETGTEDTAGGL